MRAKKINKQIVFDDRLIFAYIDNINQQKVSSKITEKTFKIVDVFQREYDVHLKTIIRIENVIPEIMSFHAEGTTPELAKTILEKRGVDFDKPLAYFIFKKK